GNYPGFSHSILLMPPIDVPEGNAYLQFKQWYKFRSPGYAVDAGEILVSTDQKNWSAIARFTGQTSAWQYIECNLSDYEGERIYVAFQLDSNLSPTEPGWYLDDVALSDTSIFNMNTKRSIKKVKAEDTLSDKIKNKDPDALVGPEVVNSGLSKKIPVSGNQVDRQIQVAANVQTLPLDATVSVVETGVFVNTDPATGSYSMVHPAGTYTLQAEAYGFYSDTQSVQLPKDGTVEANFTLQPIPKGTVSGTVTNKATGEPVSGATLMLMEDAAVTPVKTDENGHYSITAYEGDYTMHISAADYYGKDVKISVEGNGDTERNVALKPFIGYPGEIGYDDGTAENARTFHDAGNAWAVKMSLPKGKDRAFVTGGKFRFWTKDWPDPGGTAFQVAVYDASGPGGAPGKKLAGPIDATALRNGEWTVVNLSDRSVIVDGDFYMVYIQAKDEPNAPGMAVDEDVPSSGRSWQRVDGTWSPSREADGNYMIRALVNYEAVPPVITAPKDGSFTNEGTVTIEGTSAPTTKVTLFNNGEKVASTDATAEGRFSADISLTDGENIITAVASK
ncbi:MAG TPA: carboxypeptidase regulatory-like domain-containing protein, partial [Bacillales bacterium]|nr:carboxypeptidase regulatory-like domain-containing protein [Bacillales bacterium]